MNKTDLADKLRYAYYVLEEDQREVLTIHEAIKLLDELRKLPAHEKELLVELLVELKLAEFVPLPHPIPQFGEVKGFKLRKNADFELDPETITNIALEDFQAKIQDRKDSESNDTEHHRLQNAKRKAFSKLKNKHDSLCREIAVAEMAIVKRRSDIEVFRARIAAGIIRANTARAFQLCIEEHSRLESRLRDLVDKRDEVAYKLSLFD